MTPQPTYLPPERAFTPEVRTRLRARILGETEEPAPRRGRRLAWPLAGAGLTAAALLGVFALSAPDPGPPGGHPVTGQATAVTYSALALKAAEQNPRLLVDRPGWTVTAVSGFSQKQGMIEFSNAEQSLDITWYPADLYARHRVDRLKVSEPEPVKVDGWPGEVIRYSATDFAVLLAPRDTAFAELRTDGTGWTRDDLDRVLADVEHVGVRTWLDSLPADIVTPDRVGEQAAKVLADVPLPPGFDLASLDDVGTNDAYQFGAEVINRVGCAWIAEWQRAKDAGDAAALRRAVDALHGSRQWQVLQELNDQGGFSELFWRTADQVTVDALPADPRDQMDCG